MSGEQLLSFCERVRALLDYDAGTGELRFAVSPPQSAFSCKRAYSVFMANYAGERAGYLHKDGYWRVFLMGKSWLAHRLIWAIQTGALPETDIDHADRNRSNNVWSNLRLASRSQNCMNRSLRSDNRSGVTGVTWHPCGMWQAQIGKNGRNRYLGLFRTVAEAAAARAAAARILHGEFSSHEQEIANASRAHTRDAREGDHETAGSTVRLSGNAALSSPVVQAPETGHVDRSASARPRDAVGNGVNPAVDEPSCWQGQGVREPVTGNAQPSGAGTGSAVRTGAPSFEAA